MRTRKGHKGGKPAVTHAASSVRAKQSPAAGPVPRVPRPARKVQHADIHPLDRAIAELRNELARTPDNAMLLGRLGALYYRRGNLPAAENSYRQAIALQPEKPSLHNNLGNVLCDRGHIKEGIACYEQAMVLEQAADPAHGPSAEAETNLELARLEYRLVQERIEYLEQAVKLEVQSSEALNALGGGYLLRNERPRALETFRQAARVDLRNVQAACNVGFVHSLDLGASGGAGAALSELAEAAVRFPQEPRLFIHQAELHEAQGQFEEAERSYCRALQADPRCLEVYGLLGRLRELLGATSAHDRTARAVRAALETLTQSARTAGPGTPAGALDLARVELARARFTRRPSAGSREAEGLLREAQRLAEAQPAAQDQVTVPAAILRAQLLEGARQRAEAAQVLERASQLRPQSERLWFERGGLAFRMGEVRLAVECFERATLAQPQEAPFYHSLRFAFEGYRRYRTERVRFEAALRANPHDALAHYHLALAALSVLKDSEAQQLFQKALELDGRLAVAACGLGRALQHQGLFAQAQAAYQRALEMDPACAEAQRGLQALALEMAASAGPR